MAGLEEAVQLASGHRHTCAVQRSGRTWCWDGTPVEVTGLAKVVQLAGGSDHTCARLQSGRVACWGGNAAGQFGQPRTVSRRPTPTPVRNVADAVHLGLGAQHTCAARKTGEVVC